MTDGEKTQRAKDFLSSYALYKQWLGASRYDRGSMEGEAVMDDVF